MENKQLRQNIRNFLMLATPSELQRELELSNERGDHVRAGFVQELIDEREDTPNLDGMDIDELCAYWKNENNPEKLRKYAAAIYNAKQCRMTCKIATALHWERMANAIYHKLPAAMKW